MSYLNHITTEHDAAQSSSIVGSSPHSGHRVAFSPRNEYPHFMHFGTCASATPASTRIGQYHIVHAIHTPHPIMGRLTITASQNEVTLPPSVKNWSEIGAPMNNSHAPHVVANTLSDHRTAFRQIKHHAISTMIAQNKYSQKIDDVAHGNFKTVSRKIETMMNIPAMTGNIPIDAPRRANHGNRRCALKFCDF